jgi:hypothetical protein
MIKKKEFQTKYIELPSSFPFPKFSFDWVWQNVTEKELDFFREVLKCNEIKLYSQVAQYHTEKYYG